jgi:hypothetical protein
MDSAWFRDDDDDDKNLLLMDVTVPSDRTIIQRGAEKKLEYV